MEMKTSKERVEQLVILIFNVKDSSNYASEYKIRWTNRWLQMGSFWESIAQNVGVNAFFTHNT